MTFDEVLAQVQALLRQEKRVSYWGLKRRFTLDDEYLEDLKEELIGAKRIATDEDGRFLVWTGAAPVPGSEFQVPSSTQHPTPNTQHLSAERRQLTVMFCDLVGSTALSTQVDPEDLREVVRQYQQTCATVIQQHEGYIAQYLGDGLLVYFGYPTAHEDDARRAVRTGLGIIEAIWGRVTGDGGQARRRPLQVRIGIHTGLVVIGDIGTSGRTEQLALGETPNIAARIQGLAEPNTVIISAATQRLVEGQFEGQQFGSHQLKGIETPIAVSHVQSERQSGSRLEGKTTLTSLVGREEELALLHRRWGQVKDREGQIVLLSGEPGIGKSRLVRELRDRVEQDSALHLEFRCSPYYQNSALHPVIEHLQRLLDWQKEDTPQIRTAKLHTTLARYQFPQADTPTLFAALLSLPQPTDAPPLNLSPQRQKQKTEEALIAWLVEEAEHAPVYCAWEDLHWADPSTLELLGMLIDQTPTTRLFVLLTSRPEFTPPWGQHGHFSQLTLSRLGRRQVPQMIEQATRGKTLPPDVVQQIVAKTDGVPLFVEELTKTVLESLDSLGSIESIGSAIPATLHDSLMARLDRLGAVKEIAQVGATLGREFSYDLLHAVSPADEPLLQQGLSQLVAVELLYQRGIPPQSTYLFKHALIQDTAYQSLLKSRRQQLHQQVAQVLEDRFSDTQTTQPELLAHHYTEAGLIEQAIPHWQQAGQKASQRSANAEAISSLTRGLELLKTLPGTPERAQQELTLQIALGVPLMATKGFATPEVGAVYRRARELCQQVGETPQLFPVLWGLWAFYVVQAEFQTAQELGEQCLRLARNVQDPALLMEAHYALEATFANRGEATLAQEHFVQVIALYNPQQHRSLAFLYGGLDPEILGRGYAAAWFLWFLGYPDQALVRSHEALTLAQGLSHPFSLVWALLLSAELHQHRREGQLAQERAEAAILLASEQGFAFELALGTSMRGRTLAEQGQVEEGIAQMHRGLDAHRATGAKIGEPYDLALLAEAYGKVGQGEDGLSLLAEALVVVDRTGERVYEAELYRLKGELTLQSQASLGHVWKQRLKSVSGRRLKSRGNKKRSR